MSEDAQSSEEVGRGSRITAESLKSPGAPGRNGRGKMLFSSEFRSDLYSLKAIKQVLPR